MHNLNDVDADSGADSSGGNVAQCRDESSDGDECRKAEGDVRRSEDHADQQFRGSEIDHTRSTVGNARRRKVDGIPSEENDAHAESRSSNNECGGPDEYERNAGLCQQQSGS